MYRCGVDRSVWKVYVGEYKCVGICEFGGGVHGYICFIYIYICLYISVYLHVYGEVS